MLPEIKYYKLLAWDCLSSIRDFLGASHNDFFSVVDADKTISIEQVSVAYERARRLISYSEKIKRPESAFLMLLSGEKQISRAQEEIGISSSTKNILAVYSSQEDLMAFEGLCQGLLKAEKAIPIPERALEMDGIVFTRMARVELSI